LDQHILMIAEPEAVALEARWRIDQLDAAALNARFEPRQVLGVAAKREMVQRLALAFHHRTPAVFVAECSDRQCVAVVRDVETEIAVEVLRDFGVGHRQHELVERMHAERIGFSRGRHIAVNGGHRLLPSGSNLTLGTLADDALF
jgi:hypothetical protein